MSRRTSAARLVVAAIVAMSASAAAASTPAAAVSASAAAVGASAAAGSHPSPRVRAAAGGYATTLRQIERFLTNPPTSLTEGAKVCTVVKSSGVQSDVSAVKTEGGTISDDARSGMTVWNQLARRYRALDGLLRSESAPAGTRFSALGSKPLHASRSALGAIADGGRALNQLNCAGARTGAGRVRRWLGQTKSSARAALSYLRAQGLHV